MTVYKLLEKINAYYNLANKLAASPEFLKLRDEKAGKLWFSDDIAKANGDKHFAVLDQANIKAIQQIANEGYLPVEDREELVSWYLNHERTQELISFICERYNKYFPQLNAYTVLDHLKNSGDLDAGSGATSPNPIFILVHDLLHQVLQSDFSESLQNQSDMENEGLNPSLLDELNEDIASSLSNFQPNLKNVGQGIWKYLRHTFIIKWDAKQSQKADSVEDFQQKLKQTIEETFHYAKAELRGKVDKLVDRHTINSLKIPAQVKQLVDGTLSRAKHQMLQQAEDISDEAFELKINYASKLFDMFDLGYLAEQHYDKIMESRTINQTDSSALRGWMLECLGAMKRLNNYFTNELEQELLGEYEELEEDE